MKTKWNAAVFAIIFWAIWIHKFYLWKPIQAIIYIIITLAWFPIVPFILWIIEWIRYITLKKDDFDLEYNLEYMKKQDFINNRK